MTNSEDLSMTQNVNLQPIMIQEKFDMIEVKCDRKNEISGGLSTVQISELSLANNDENKVNKDVKIDNGDMRVAQLSLVMKDCEQEIESLRSKLEQNEWHLKTKVMTPVFSFEEHLEIFGWMEDIIF